MHRLMAFVALIAILLSLGAVPVAHAMEQETSCASTVETAASIFDLDRDMHSAPADGDKDYPHQHGTCHGHHVAAPFDSSCEVTHRSVKTVHVAMLEAGDASTIGDPALRPPQA